MLVDKALYGISQEVMESGEEKVKVVRVKDQCTNKFHKRSEREDTDVDKRAILR